MNHLSPIVPRAPRDIAFDRPFGLIAYGLLLLVILGSTYLHHFQPHVLQVPDNTDIAAWKHPAFEHTVIYDRLKEEEREKLLANGVPAGDQLLAQFLVMDLFTILLGWVCFQHARRHYGFWMASCFLIGSFVFTGLEESMWILIGRFSPQSTASPLGEPVYGTYWFTKGGFWFFETPLTACVGWFFLAYSCVLVAGKAFPKMGLLGRATVGGLIAMGIDLWMDPVATSAGMMNWVWAKGDVLLVFGIPHTNFLGWFLLIFLFAIFWENLPRFEQRWGRAKATLVFYGIIFATEVAILVFFMVWIAILGNMLSHAGIGQAVTIPKGW
jgi:Carotenoid biosynthesis protein